jgi:hypothetical protein
MRRRSPQRRAKDRWGLRLVLVDGRRSGGPDRSGTGEGVVDETRPSPRHISARLRPQYMSGHGPFRWANELLDPCLAISRRRYLRTKGWQTFVMTKVPAGVVVVSEQVHERVVERECEACGTRFEPPGRGRPARYCSARCRQRAWALRHAAEQLEKGDDPRPQVVREIVDRETVVVQAAPASVPATAIAPTRPRHWIGLLDELADQLADPGHAAAKEHWHHQKLYDSLVLAVAALGRAHPGGLDALASNTARRRKA